MITPGGGGGTTRPGGGIAAAGGGDWNRLLDELDAGLLPPAR